MLLELIRRNINLLDLDKVADEKKHWFGTLPGILTGVAAVIGAIASLYVAVSGKHESNSTMEAQPTPNIEQHDSTSMPSPEPLNQTQPLTTTQPSQSLSPINISSTWHELYPNPGNISRTIQDGNTFRFTIIGAIQDFPFQSAGNGIIKGQYLESNYQSTIPSTGRCAGTLSSDGMQIKLTCDDSVTGQYETAWVRE